jgi:hypothetical protein
MTTKWLRQRRFGDLPGRFDRQRIAFPPIDAGDANFRILRAVSGSAGRNHPRAWRVGLNPRVVPARLSPPGGNPTTALAEDARAPLGPTPEGVRGRWLWPCPWGLCPLKAQITLLASAAVGLGSRLRQMLAGSPPIRSGQLHSTDARQTRQGGRGGRLNSGARFPCASQSRILGSSYVLSSI